MGLGEGRGTLRNAGRTLGTSLLSRYRLAISGNVCQVHRFSLSSSFSISGSSRKERRSVLAIYRTDSSAVSIDLNTCEISVSLS